MIDYSGVWQIVTYGMTAGIGLGLLMYFFGMWFGIGLRWFESVH